MPILNEYIEILEAAKRKRKENKTFIDNLKKQRPHNLDRITNSFHDNAFLKIDCLKCANCCTTTGPLFKNRDINTLASTLKMKQSEFADKYLKIDEDGDWVLKRTPCCFLKDDNHCSVYDSRPTACSQFPHTQQRDIAAKLPITYLNTMICPAVALVVDELKRYYS